MSGRTTMHSTAPGPRRRSGSPRRSKARCASSRRSGSIPAPIAAWRRPTAPPRDRSSPR